MRKRMRTVFYGAMIEVVLLVAMALSARGQTADGNTGLSEANTMIRGYFDTATQVMYAIGAIGGLIGAIHVFYKMSQGDRDTGRVAGMWFGACIFLVIVATVLKSFFGL